MKRLLRLLCALLCLALLPLPVLGDESAPNVRVLLRRLNLTDRADLILDGVYTAATGSAASMAFPKGSEVTVQIRAGQLYLFYQGMSMQVGESIRFIRNASDSQSSEGIRFSEDGNLYPGDLSLSIEGGELQPILTLSVEDYLQGVVPYEMSNSFPLEALKAQAVCARTYALSKVNSSAAYDLVDTTNDQVFRGVNATYTNAIRAVQETAGVVGTYKGKLATCFYAASNGGQTELVEHVWDGGGDYGYYAVTDDPYDLENPESIVRRTRIPKKGSVSDAFTALLAKAIDKDMRTRGFGSGASCLRVDAITDMKLATPRFDEPNRLMTQLTLTFSWSGRRVLSTAEPMATTVDSEISLFATAAPVVTPAPTTAADVPSPTTEPSPTPDPTPAYSAFEAVEEPATVTIELFPDGIRALNLSVYGADNELVTLTETDTHFVLESRRYGHGVGMSQRGAQWMAGKYGKLFHEILAFYYPGMTLMRVQAGDPVLPTAQPELVNSPAPPATPTPRPTLMPVTVEQLPEGAYLASVEGIEDDSSLNLRAEPHTAADILMRLYKHQQLIVLEVCDDPAWVRIKTDVIEGYVMVRFLSPID
ncbi:MAG: SpoIID/LytB domain-containing protein [Aristaeellaceae bacterium]